MPQTIVIVDDEQDIRDLVCIHLKKAGYFTKSFEDGQKFWDWIKKKENSPSLILLDLMLPDTDGLEVCKKLKSSRDFLDIPVIMLTAKSEEIDKILGLELGADDYVTKPFSPKELVARVKSILRRYKRTQQNDLEIREITKELILDFSKHQVLAHGKPLTLTITEFKLLELLSDRKGQVYSRDQLLEHLWGGEKFASYRSVDVHIRHLRMKLGKLDYLISNIRGIGYKLEV